TFHSTARQAATIATKAAVGKLILGHYSVRYKDLSPLLQEAREVFPDTILGLEGENIVLAQ
ncbi:MAG: ribonuclease Z, partial [Cyclobacteriaceae bacterium]